MRVRIFDCAWRGATANTPRANGMNEIRRMRSSRDCHPEPSERPLCAEESAPQREGSFAPSGLRMTPEYPSAPMGIRAANHDPDPRPAAEPNLYRRSPVPAAAPFDVHHDRRVGPHPFSIDDRHREAAAE